MVPRGSKFWLGGLILYLAMPIDLVPDFVPIAGQLDDAIIVALVLRLVLRRAGEVPIRQHWPVPSVVAWRLVVSFVVRRLGR
jgi:uncharacterized membrane protein YkvA (DUF1232 family)